MVSDTLFSILVACVLASLSVLSFVFFLIYISLIYSKSMSCSTNINYFLCRSLYSCGADKVGMVWDAEVGERVKKLNGHISYVNSIRPARRGPPLIVTGSDDCTAKV